MTPPPRLVPDRPSDAAIAAAFHEFGDKSAMDSPTSSTGAYSWVLRRAREIDAAAPLAEAPGEGDYSAGIAFIVRNKENLIKLCAGPSEQFVVERTLDILAAPRVTGGRESGWRTDWPEMRPRSESHPSIWQSERVIVTLTDGTVTYDRAESFEGNRPLWFVHRERVQAWRPFPAPFVVSDAALQAATGGASDA